MRALFKIVAFYGVMILISIISQSCCREELKIIGLDDIIVYQDMEGARSYQDSIYGPFTLNMRSLIEIAYQSTKETPLISSAFGYQCHYDHLNNLDTASFQISSDRNFTYRGEVIESNDSFDGIPQINTYNYSTSGGLSVQFDEEFIKHVHFEDGIYTFTLSVQTNDGIELKGEKTLIFDL